MSTGPKAAYEAIAATHAGPAGPGGDEAQLDLLAEAGDEALPVAPTPEAARRGPGRPPGARNKRTEILAAHYVRRHGDPLEALIALAMGSIEHTATELHRTIQALKAKGVPIAVDTKGRELSGIDVAEVMKLKVRAAEAALPYLHARRAPIDSDGEAVLPVLNIGVGVQVGAGGRPAATGGGGLDIEALAAERGTVAPQGFADDDDEGVA